MLENFERINKDAKINPIIKQKPTYTTEDLPLNLRKVSLKEDLIVTNKPISSDFYICKLCNEIVRMKNLKFCKKCESLFCEQCLDYYFSNHQSKCPNCEIIPFKKSKIISFLKYTLLNICLKCPLDCNEEFKYEQLEDHLLKCKNRLQKFTCNFCQRIFF